MPSARASVPAPLPDCTPLFDAEAMREADRRAGEDHAIPGILLMERAGLTSAEAARASFPEVGAALVVVGPGNNGGDGMVVARHLAEAGWEVEVAGPGGRAPGTPDGAAMAAIAASLGIPVGALETGRPAGARLVVDALLGTGAHGAPRGEAAGAVEWMAGHDGPVMSLDVPSGVDAGSGRVEGAAVRARMTVTYHGDMVGLRIAPGREHAGRVVVADIGIPGAVALPPAAWLVGAGAVAAVPRKGEAGDKYAAGAVLVVAGSPGLTGAASLAARATLRAGGGLTVVAVPAAVQPAVAAHLLEVMCAPLPDRDGHLAPESVERVASEAGRASALAIGPGLGRAECTTEALLQILDRVALPAVLDADGLWHLGDAPERLAGRSAPTVITPHTGEAARLLGTSRGEVEAGRLDAARELARRSGAVAVLKGPGTIVASPGGEVAVGAGGTPALATAGTGDVLTGTVAALLAKGMDPFRAAAVAVAAHARAGELADRGDGTIASDVLEALPAALRLPAPASR
jgi:ADP-dependent NAD(P)H-hydrate dehydratase / NAD(P)H-hydrate epimerase